MRVGSPAEDTGVVIGEPKRMPGEIDPLTAVQVRVVGPAVDVQIHMAVRRQRERRAVMRIVLDRLPEQIECCDYILFFPRVSMRRARR